MAAPDFNKANRIIDAALSKMKEKVSIVEPKFNQMLIDWINKFDTSSGNISKSKSNNKRLLAFKRAFERMILRSGYNEMVSEFLVNFEELQDNQQTFQRDFNGIKLNKKFLNPYKRFAINQTVNDLQKSGLDVALLRPIQDELFTSVNQGGSLKDMIESLEAQIVTTKESSGLMRRLVTTASRDALGQYNGKVNEAVRKSFKMDGILYVGSNIKDTRPQCLRWTGWRGNGEKGLLKVEELQDQINWAFNNGTGMNKATTVETFTAYRGGFNCRHSAYPTRLENYR